MDLFVPRRKLPGSHRTIAPTETVRRVRGLASRFGVTRLADITGLDRIGIPVFSAMVPKSDDFISVYSGKGIHRDEAAAGALMETIERQAVLRPRPRTFTATCDELRRQAPIVDPCSLITQLAENYSSSRPYEWMEGYDLLHECVTFVPAGIAGYRWRHLPHCNPLRRTTTHGLAAGNCLEEAVAQGLCELIERDAWTLAELGAHWWRRAYLENAGRYDPGLDFPDDRDRHPCIDLSGLGDSVGELLRRFRGAGLNPVVRDVTSGLNIPTVLASVAEDEIAGFPQAHMGVGAHPDLQVAVARALTEAAQSRAADIQGVRKDLAPAAGDGDATGVVIHTRRVSFVDRRRWIHSKSSFLRSGQEIATVRNTDVLEDLSLLLDRIRRAGVKQVVMADFSPPNSGVFVVRMIVPGLEMWIADRGRLGERATVFWKNLEPVPCPALH